MANINKNINYAGIPGGWRRGGAYPLDPSDVFYSLSSAQDYAQNDPTSYVGQYIAVVNEAERSAQAFMIVNVEGELVEIGSGTGSAMIFVDTLSALKTLGTPPTGVPEDLIVGQQAFVSENKKIYFLTSLGSTAPTSYVWESQASDAPIWNSTNSSINSRKVDFNYEEKTTADFDPSNYSDPGVVYFVSVEGTDHIIFNGKDFSSSIKSGVGVTAANAVDGVLYYTLDSQSGYYKLSVLNGESLLDLIPSVERLNDQDTSGVVTLNRLTDYINTQLQALSYDSSSGELSLGNGSATLTGVVNNASYDQTTSRLTLPSFGGEAVTVDIPSALVWQEI